MILQIIGFLFLLGLAIYLSVVAVSTFVGELGFMGKLAFTWIFLVLAIVLWWTVYLTFPFHVTLGVS